MDGIIPIDVLDDLCSRFIINVPEEERKNVIRICFQIELAHWFYIDFYSKQKETRKICNLKEFASIVFKHVPFLHPFVEKVDKIIDEWKEYKYCVPTYGAILLNEDLSHALLVQSYCSKSSWGFPKGKINKGESPWQCAIREVLEETGFDIREHMDPTEYVEAVINDQTVRLYIIPGISMDQQFVPRTRNEIKSVNWFPLADLPATKKEATTKLKTMSGTMSLFMVTPFVRKLREWIYENYGRTPKKAKSKRPRNKSCGDLDYLELKDYVNQTPDKKKGGKKGTDKEVFVEDVEEKYSTPGAKQGGHKSRKSVTSEGMSVTGSSNLASEAEVKVRRTLEYVMSQNPNMSSSPVTNPSDHPAAKKTPSQIRILKKPDTSRPQDRPISGKELLTTLFSKQELTAVDATTKIKTAESVQASVGKHKSSKPVDNLLAESPQSKSFGNIQHDRVLSSFARVSHKAGGRNYFLSHSPAVDHPKNPDCKSADPHDSGKPLKFTEITFSKSFEKNGAKAWSNFKFDRQAVIKRLNG
uniref:m7GpppN-mRNA hydrolase n=2 Tax=Lygus hesperus TaxID=30085 RepID=A0A146KZE5_LYGHE